MADFVSCMPFLIRIRFYLMWIKNIVVDQERRRGTGYHGRNSTGRDRRYRMGTMDRAHLHAFRLTVSKTFAIIENEVPFLDVPFLDVAAAPDGRYGRTTYLRLRRA